MLKGKLSPVACFRLNQIQSASICLREFGLTHVILTTGACWGGSVPRTLTPFPADPADPADQEACAKVGFRLREAEISVENV